MRVWDEPVAFHVLAPPVSRPRQCRMTTRCACAASTPASTASAGTRSSVPLADRTTVLDALFYVLRRHDRSLAFRCACRAAMCGSCGMVVNGTERLACRTPLAEVAGSGVVRVEPLRNLPVVKDLVVDTDPFFEQYAASGAVRRC